MFRNLFEAYDVIIKNNFPLLSKELSILGESDTLLVSCSVKDRYKGVRQKDYPSYKMFFLKSESLQPKKDIYFLTEDQAEKLKNQIRKNGRILNHKGKSYTFISAKFGILDWIYEDTPLLNLIYQELKGKIKDYFE